MLKVLPEEKESNGAVAGAFVGVKGPTGFVTGAAMIAVLAGLGFAISGGGGSSAPSAADRQSSQGTGSVFGDTSLNLKVLQSLRKHF